MVLTRTRVPLIGLLWLAIGAGVAGSYHFFENVDTAKEGLSALLAVLLWPLVVAGVNLHIH
jgi:hypothetical protein